MFRAILLAHDDGACALMENLAIESRQITFAKSLDRYPQAYELTKLMNQYAPELIFLDFDHWESARAAAADARAISPQIAIIGFGPGFRPSQQKDCAQFGVTELLVTPITLKKFEDAVDRAIHKMQDAIQENLLAFLPAKAGSGSTTVALNIAGYLADPLGRKVLLIDGDLNSSVVGALLDLKHCHSLRQALENSAQLDSSEWSKFVTKSRGFDLLLPDHPRKGPLPSWTNYHHLLDFAAKLYDHIVVDLPEVINDATVETVRRAKQVFIVCTPELPSLALAPHRIEELTSRGIPAQKISVVLNRWQKGEICETDLQEM